MRLTHGDGERVVTRIHSLPARELRRPRCERCRVQRVAAQPNVKDDCIEADRSRAVEERDQLSLLLLGRKPSARGPVAIGRGTEPGAPKLAQDDWRKDGTIAQSDARHVARCALGDDALRASSARAAEEETGRGRERTRAATGLAERKKRQRRARRHFVDRRVRQGGDQGEATSAPRFAFTPTRRPAAAAGQMTEWTTRPRVKSAVENPCTTANGDSISRFRHTP